MDNLTLVERLVLNSGCGTPSENPIFLTQKDINDFRERMEKATEADRKRNEKARMDSITASRFHWSD